MVPAVPSMTPREAWRVSPRPPAWVARQLGAVSTLHSASFDITPSMSPVEFQDAVSAAYRTLLAEVGTLGGPRPVRFWSFLPGIHDALGDDLDRYMVFNAGRHAVFAEHFGAVDFARGAIPTASAVGIGGHTLHVHCLAADVVADAIENPRQVPAYRYSRRFGPRPPSFARATRIARPDAPPLLLVGGTASIRGEDSRNIDDLARQLDETLLNLAAVVAAAEGTPVPASDAEVRRCLGRYAGLRAYFLHDAQHDAIAARIAGAVGATCDVELLPATMCRPELLVEIEGVATLAPAPTGDPLA
jgi:chorismate lyase/3-hydroxybenzoate synthase